MQKAKFVKNPAVRDTLKITSKLSTHDSLIIISCFSGTYNFYIKFSIKFFLLLFGRLVLYDLRRCQSGYSITLNLVES